MANLWHLPAVKKTKPFSLLHNNQLHLWLVMSLHLTSSVHSVAAQVPGRQNDTNT